MVRFFALALVAIGLSSVVWADDKKEEPPLSGTWQRDAEGFDLSFEFKTKSELIVVVEGGGNGVTLVCKYEVDKEFKVKAEVTEVKEKGEFPAKPRVGYKMSFVFKIDKDKQKAKITDFEGENAEEAKAIVEGEYKKKKSD